jgi:predicted amidohydrolase
MIPLRSLAVAQTIPKAGDVVANTQTHVRLAKLAAKELAQVLVFPELSLVGYEMDLAQSLAFSREDPRLNPLREVAASCSILLVVGAPVQLAEHLYLGAFLIYPDGEVDLYTKHRLGAFAETACVDGVVPAVEATVFHPGRLNPLVRYGEHQAAVAICADTGQASHPQLAAERGANAYLASMFVIPSEFQRESANLETYAKKYSMTVLFSNYGGPSGGLAAAGQSAIWSEKGEQICQLSENGTGIGVAFENGTGWGSKTIQVDFE